MINHLIPKVPLIILTSVVSISVCSQTSVDRKTPAAQVEPASEKQMVRSDRRADRALERSIYKALAKYTDIDAGNISVVAKKGVVTVSGIVRDADQIGAVKRIVKSVQGVLVVTNKLTVQRAFEE
ncbi:BON domain-containing protein [Paraburkholderia sp. A3BS-1L]|uniref:BON domain-containing protein n=1 Tax=Paraburkholderia sp. A3BS-1L TaxID=3028375 RepID=UPI003DA8F4CC